MAVALQEDIYMVRAPGDSGDVEEVAGPSAKDVSPAVVMAVVIRTGKFAILMCDSCAIAERIKHALDGANFSRGPPGVLELLNGCPKKACQCLGSGGAELGAGLDAEVPGRTTLIMDAWSFAQPGVREARRGTKRAARREWETMRAKLAAKGRRAPSPPPLASDDDDDAADC